MLRYILASAICEFGSGTQIRSITGALLMYTYDSATAPFLQTQATFILEFRIVPVLAISYRMLN